MASWTMISTWTLHHIYMHTHEPIPAIFEHWFKQYHNHQPYFHFNNTNAHLILIPNSLIFIIHSRWLLLFFIIMSYWYKSIYLNLTCVHITHIYVTHTSTTPPPIHLPVMMIHAIYSQSFLLSLCICMSYVVV